MHLSVLVIAFFIATVVDAQKVTPEILTCARQIEGRYGSESNEKVKIAIESLLGMVKTADYRGAQKVLADSAVADRMMAINKYMVDDCGSMKTCMICPLELA